MAPRTPKKSRDPASKGGSGRGFSLEDVRELVDKLRTEAKVL